MKGVRLLDLKPCSDQRGSLIALEALSKQVPFEIKRIYYIFDVKNNATRGKHAHYNLQQVLICVSGSVDIMTDDGKETASFHLDTPDKALYIDGLIWREMNNFSKDAVLIVLASEHFLETNYIRNYDGFLQEVQKR